MNRSRGTFTRVLALALAGVWGLSLPAAAITGSTAHKVPYVIEFHLLNSLAHPYTGELVLNFNNGIISGTYTDTSVKPGSPLANRVWVPVTGGVRSDGYIHFTVGPMRFHGTLHGDEISGTALTARSTYTFTAKQGKLR